MRKYDKEFKEEAVKLFDEVGVKQAAAQLGVSYYTLAEWRQKRKAYGDHAFVGSGIRRDAPPKLKRPWALFLYRKEVAYGII
jgi:transposase